MAYFNKTWNEEKSFLIGIVHGAIEACNSKKYPSVYTRVNSPENLNWIMTEVFDESVPTDPVNWGNCLDRFCSPTGGIFFTCDQGKFIDNN